MSRTFNHTRLSATADANFTYDANGSLKTKVTAQGTWEYDWDSENRLIRVTRPDLLVVNYRYDALGRRVERRTGPGEWTRFTYDGLDVVLDRQPGGVSLEYGNGIGIDDKLWQKANSGAPIWYMTDHQSSTRALMDGAGNVVGTLNYDTYGNSAGFAQTRFDYTGRERDVDTGLLYYRARWYDPQIGRFLSEDPIGFAGGRNFYTYIANNPLNYVDPSGLCGCSNKEKRLPKDFSDKYDTKKLIPCLLDAAVNAGIGLLPFGGIVKAVLADYIGIELHLFEWLAGNEGLFDLGGADVLSGYTGAAKDIAKFTYEVQGGEGRFKELEKKDLRFKERINKGKSYNGVKKGRLDKELGSLSIARKWSRRLPLVNYLATAWDLYDDITNCLDKSKR